MSTQPSYTPLVLFVANRFLCLLCFCAFCGKFAFCAFDLAIASCTSLLPFVPLNWLLPVVPRSWLLASCGSRLDFGGVAWRPSPVSPLASCAFCAFELAIASCTPLVAKLPLPSCLLRLPSCLLSLLWQIRFLHFSRQIVRLDLVLQRSDADPQHRRGLFAICRPLGERLFDEGAFCVCKR